MDPVHGNIGNLVEPGQELRASAILTAAFVAAEPIFCSGFTTVTIVFTYARGAANGAFDWYLSGSIYGVDANAPAGAEVWGPESLFAAGAVAAGVLSQNRVQLGYETYQEQGAATESFSYGIIEIGGLDRLRLTVQESGVVGTPGTLQAQVGMR